ncbi:hypothetical protein DESC_820041 [Desulfosarcina cetonica]|nr:hypothetical protein DESC_820041 [Desulfosarcina cetonica]
MIPRREFGLPELFFEVSSNLFLWPSPRKTAATGIRRGAFEGIPASSTVHRIPVEGPSMLLSGIASIGVKNNQAA